MMQSGDPFSMSDGHVLSMKRSFATKALPMLSSPQLATRWLTSVWWKRAVSVKMRLRQSRSQRPRRRFIRTRLQPRQQTQLGKQLRRLRLLPASLLRQLFLMPLYPTRAMLTISTAAIQRPPHAWLNTRMWTALLLNASAMFANATPASSPIPPPRAAA